MVSHKVFRTIERADPDVMARLGAAGVATVHEAAGRTGLVGAAILPRQEGLTIVGSAVTVSSHPGDNLMLHAAVEVTQPGDILIVSNTSPSMHGMFGDLMATSLQARGVLGIVSDAGVRDITTLRRMGFGVWSRVVHAQGTVKATPGSVNIPVVLEGQLVSPGDVVVADDDGVVVIPRGEAAAVADAAESRIAKEEAKRQQFAAGSLALDVYEMRGLIEQLGIEYVD